jgi:transposase
MSGQKFGLKSLRKRFPTDAECLAYIMKVRFGTHCICGGTFARVPERRQFQCSHCGTQIAPTAGTIFEKSKVPLTMWFHAIMMFSNAKSGLSAKTIQRDLEITYKCAWRMATLIRGSLIQSEEKLSGIVEADMGFFGGKGVGGKDNEHLGAVMRAKTKVFGAIARGSGMRAKVVPDGSARVHKQFLDAHVTHVNTHLMTDAAQHYTHSAKKFFRESVNHKRGEYVRGKVHTNSMDSFWSHVKASVRGTHKSISPKYFQSYLDGFVFHQNNRYSDKARFEALLGIVLRDRVA